MKKNLLCVFSLIVVLKGFADKNTYNYYLKGLKCIKKNEYSKAINYLTLANKDNEYTTKLAFVYYETKEYTKAKNILVQQKNNYLNHPNKVDQEFFYLLLACTLYELNEYPKAEEYFMYPSLKENVYCIQKRAFLAWAQNQKSKGDSLWYNANELKSNRKIKKEEFLLDLDSLKNTILKKHPLPFHFVSKHTWDSIFEHYANSVSSEIGILNAYGIYNSLLNYLEDAHCAINFKSEDLYNYYNFTIRLPFKIHFYKNDLVLSHYKPRPDTFNVIGLSNSIPFQLSHFTKKDFELCKQNLFPSVENTTQNTLFNLDFEHFYRLYLNSTTRLKLFLEKENKIVVYSDIQFLKQTETKKELFQFKFTDKNTAYLKVQSFSQRAFKEKDENTIDSITALHKWIIKALTTVNKKNPSKLQIDLRNGAGGSPYLASLILQYLSKDSIRYLDKFYINHKFISDTALIEGFKSDYRVIQNKINIGSDTLFEIISKYTVQKKRPGKCTGFNGSIEVLIDNEAYSASIQLPYNLRKYLNAKLIGQNMRGRSNYCNAFQFYDFQLPHSRFYFKVPFFLVKTDNLPLIDQGVQAD